ncbi:AraC family transcriptional regulator [Budviciaceae bacterium BWR-B9]|uniref:AraC family transcriptional regulator n=1 Tax=Limnobaculum allomyrinae TaxID=2791986 RepID=A0ABS1ILB7_9GAMM|nr:MULTISPECIES: AraC family transcriptional regulator [Limnobaculum]MBK5142528.1 AraC family transcriptional regulator [Limnobaculum allomyrinae]MBV7690588.1 helix-turn-helix domain-containing protein [Limnobaculum sp. M2-1]
MSSSSIYQCNVYFGLDVARASDILYGGYFEHRLSSSAQLSLYHQRVILDDIRLETGNYSFPIIARGCTPSDSICIGFMAHGSDVTRYNTVPIGTDEIQIYPEGTELLYQSSGSSRWVIYAVSRTRLQQAMHAFSGQEVTLSKENIVSLKLPEGCIDKLLKQTNEVFTIAQNCPDSSPRMDILKRCLEQLLLSYSQIICDAMSASSIEKKSSVSQRHNNLILDSEYFVMSCDDVSASLINIAQRTGYSLRALELIFRNSVGMSPGKWFLNLRLNGTLRDLLMATPISTVSGIATRWGFQHLSRFSEQYRKTFGEYPSHTLNRSKKREGTVFSEREFESQINS